MPAHEIYAGHSGVSGDDDRRTRRYRAWEEATEADALAAALALAPATIDGLPRRNVEFDEVDSVNSIYEYTVNWGQSSNRPDLASDDIEAEFSFSAPSFHARQSLATISRTGLGAITEKKAGGGTVSVTHVAEDFHGAIHVVRENGQYRVDGVQLSPPPEKFSIRYAPVLSKVTGSYLATLAAICDAPVNAFPVTFLIPGVAGPLTFAAGELMVVRITASLRNTDSWSFYFGFAQSPNLTNIDVGGITVPAKKGFDYLWAFYGDSCDNTSGNLIQRPTAAYVEQVYRASNFNLLGITA